MDTTETTVRRTHGDAPPSMNLVRQSPYQDQDQQLQACIQQHMTHGLSAWKTMSSSADGPRHLPLLIWDFSAVATSGNVLTPASTSKTLRSSRWQIIEAAEKAAHTELHSRPGGRTSRHLAILAPYRQCPYKSGHFWLLCHSLTPRGNQLTSNAGIIRNVEASTH